MVPFDNLSAFKWIEESRSTPVGKYDDRNWAGNPVSLVVPPLFDKYVKILHWIDAKYENIDNPLSDVEVAILQLPSCDPLRRLAEDHRKSGVARLKWRDVARTLQVPLQAPITDDWFRAVLEPGCWPRYVYGPAEGVLQDEECSALANILLAQSGGDNAYFKMADMHFYGDEEKSRMFRGSVSEAVFISADSRYNTTPEYWWPEDRSWCVCSDYDLTFTLVGCSFELFQTLLEDTVLECIEVTPNTRVDWRSIESTAD